MWSNYPIGTHWPQIWCYWLPGPPFVTQRQTLSWEVSSLLFFISTFGTVGNYLKQTLMPSEYFLLILVYLVPSQISQMWKWKSYFVQHHFSPFMRKPLKLMSPAVDLRGAQFHAIFGKKAKIIGFRPTFGVGATLWEILDLPLVNFWFYIIKGNQK